ncbi:MAG: hypothetical protein ACAH95_10445, partial [Fimbriimonas sp.]
GLSALKAEAKVLNGIVGVRHRGFWRLRQFEIPDSVKGAYEQLAKVEPLTLDQYASFATRLKPAQVAAVMLEDAFSLDLDMTPFARMMPALQFYALLSPAQKREAHSGLEAANLSPVQKKAFVDAMLNGTLKSKSPITYLSPLYAGDFSQVGVLVAEEAFESGLKDKQKRPILSARKFFIHLGTRSEPVRFEAQVKGPGPTEASE